MQAVLRAHFADSILVVGVGEVSGLVGLSTPRALISQRYIHKNFLAFSYAACSIAGAAPPILKYLGAGQRPREGQRDLTVIIA